MYIFVDHLSLGSFMKKEFRKQTQVNILHSEFNMRDKALI